MCAGAILNARIPRVWYGARDRAFGACGGVTNSLWRSSQTGRPWWAAFWEKACRAVLTAFFRGLRKREEKKRNGDLNLL